MRTAEEILKPYKRIIYEKDCGDVVCVSASVDTKDCCDAITVAQTEAWNEAIDAAAENADLDVCGDGVDVQAILNLKK